MNQNTKNAIIRLRNHTLSFLIAIIIIIIRSYQNIVSFHECSQKMLREDTLNHSEDSIKWTHNYSFLSFFSIQRTQRSMPPNPTTTTFTNAKHHTFMSFFTNPFLPKAWEQQRTKSILFHGGSNNDIRQDIHEHFSLNVKLLPPACCQNLFK